jgi:hypothetical protein
MHIAPTAKLVELLAAAQTKLISDESVRKFVFGIGTLACTALDVSAPNILVGLLSSRSVGHHLRSLDL